MGARAPLPIRLHRGHYINIVYHAGINADNPQWRTIVSEQLTELRGCGLLNVSNALYVNLAVSGFGFNGSVAPLLDESERLVHQALGGHSAGCRVVVSRVAVNQHEYPSIRLLRDLAHLYNESSEALFLYFHTKGMFYHLGKPMLADSGHRTIDNVRMTSVVVTRNWEYVLEQFGALPQLSTAGLAAACSGFQWYNFFWARGAYLRRLVTPVPSDEPHYYERWSGMLDPALVTNASAGSAQEAALDFEWDARLQGVYVRAADKLSLCAAHNPAARLDECFGAGKRLAFALYACYKRGGKTHPFPSRQH